MNMTEVLSKRSVALLLAAFMCVSCSRETITAKSFIGKWKSTRLETPTYLYENGEWEIKTEDGVILQYGIWQYEHNKIIWIDKAGSGIETDANAVLSVTPQEFRVKENDGTTTTFSRLVQN
ncbi:hypothetical protein [Sulfuriferula nivalis]|nr:hypothetical protein [Sulfuriferula nivalis]